MDLIKNKNILVIGAHSDDEVLGLGGMIIKAKKNGSKVFILIVTDSVSTQYSSSEECLHERDSSFESSCTVLGVDEYHRLKFPDMRLDTVEHVKLNEALSHFILDKNIDTVFVHHPYDVNLDHKLLFESVLVLSRPTPDQTITSLFTYYTPSSTEWGGIDRNRIFQPNIFIDIEDVLDKKIEAISKYKSEVRDFPHPRSIKNIRYMAAYFGSQVGLKAAEPFNLVRSVIKR